MKRSSHDVKDGIEKDGLFTVKLSEGVFSGMWLYYTLETTENKVLKSESGIIILKLREIALTRYFQYWPITAKSASTFEAGVTKEKRKIEPKREVYIILILHHRGTGGIQM